MKTPYIRFSKQGQALPCSRPQAPQGSWVKALGRNLVKMSRKAKRELGFGSVVSSCYGGMVPAGWREDGSACDWLHDAQYADGYVLGHLARPCVVRTDKDGNVWRSVGGHAWVWEYDNSTYNPIGE